MHGLLSSIPRSGQMESSRRVACTRERCADPNPITRLIEVRSAIFRKGQSATRLLNVHGCPKSIFSATSRVHQDCRQPLRAACTGWQIICQEARYPRIAELPWSSNFHHGIFWLAREQWFLSGTGRWGTCDSCRDCIYRLNFQCVCPGNQISSMKRKICITFVYIFGWGW